MAAGSLDSHRMKQHGKSQERCWTWTDTATGGGRRGVTQGDPLSPTIFNVVVDAVVRHWVTIAVTQAENRRERGREGRHQDALFYADDGMLASCDPQWLQWAFTQLVGLFDRVGLNTNSGKTVSMTC